MGAQACLNGTEATIAFDTFTLHRNKHDCHNEAACDGHDRTCRGRPPIQA